MLDISVGVYSVVVRNRLVGKVSRFVQPDPRCVESESPQTMASNIGKLIEHLLAMHPIFFAAFSFSAFYPELSICPEDIVHRLTLGNFMVHSGFKFFLNLIAAATL